MLLVACILRGNLLKEQRILQVQDLQDQLMTRYPHLFYICVSNAEKVIILQVLPKASKP